MHGSPLCGYGQLFTADMVMDVDLIVATTEGDSLFFVTSHTMNMASGRDGACDHMVGETLSN